MHRLPVLFLLIATVLPGQAPTAEDMEKVVARIAEITGMAAKRPVPFETITREGWKQWVEEQIREHVKPEEIRAEELALKKFGLLPADFDLRQATIDLLGEQAAAVYDHRKKRMLFVEGAGEGMMGDMVLIHELAHAVADQHFDLRRFIDKAPKTDEAQVARLAVVEGQAMWIMLEAQMQRMGGSLKQSGAMVDMFSPAAAGHLKGMFPVFDNAPLYLRQTLMFPYLGGLRFQQKAIEHYGVRGFSEVLRRPPVSTREVLHPEVWIAGARPARPALPELAALKEYTRLTDGTVGELDYQILFTQYASEKEALAASAAWRGGEFDLLEHKKDKHAVLRWATEWESEESAREFLRLYRKALAGKWRKLEVRRETGTGLEGTGDDGEFRITRAGARVSGLEGLKPSSEP